jgi:hypothetical protein
MASVWMLLYVDGVGTLLKGVCRNYIFKVNYHYYTVAEGFDNLKPSPVIAYSFSTESLSS